MHNELEMFFLVFNYIMKNKLKNNFLILLKEQGQNVIDKKVRG
jgi:hypothetical protein